MAKVHAVSSKKKLSSSALAIQAVAEGGPAAKRMKAMEKTVGPLQSPSTTATSHGNHSSSTGSTGGTMAPWSKSAQRKPTAGQLQFVKCSKCNPSLEERKARQADQRAKQMRFYVYSDQKISGTLLSGPEFRDVVEAGNSNYAKLDGTQCKLWTRLEFSLGKFLVKFANESCRKLHKGSPFCQHQHDGVTLPNRTKYIANGGGRKDGVEEARRWGAVMIFGDANLKSSFA